MLVFLDRSRRAQSYPWLEWKIRFFIGGAILAALGMARETDWLVWAGGLMLFVGFALRFLPGGKGVSDEEAESSFR